MLVWQLPRKQRVLDGRHQRQTLEQLGEGIDKISTIGLARPAQRV